MHLITFFWKGVRRFHQTLKGVHGREKKLITPIYNSQVEIYFISDCTTGLRQITMNGNPLAKPNVAHKDSIQQDIQMKG